MDSETQAHYDARGQDLRADLKKWESDWAASHDGSKPGRQDIKNNPDIAEKYKEYNRVRDIIAGKVPPPAKDETRSKKRKSDVAPSQTPLKRSKHAETPSKNRIHDDELMNSPAISRKLFSPAPVTSLGPTPQRDGRVLGLFDLLVEKELGTPSRKDGNGKTDGRANVHATPSKRAGSLDVESTARLGRTPMSSSKRQMLNTFMTPLKKKDGTEGGETPRSVSKLQFDTPAFLKRHSLPAVEEGAEFDAPAPLRLPRKPMARGLSEIVASLRKVEEDVLDDDLDALREVENDAMGIPNPPPKAPSKPTVVEDSQVHRLPLGGFDDEGLYDSPVEETTGRDGNPLRAYKKKGQKRTTRKVNMRPTRTKRPENMGQDQDSDQENDDDLIPETQAGAAGPHDPAPDADFLANGSGSDFDGEEAPAKRPRKSKTTKKSSKESAKTKDGKEGGIKKTVRKVNELAHANFHRLKLRNHGAKGGPGFNSRFRRKR